MICNASEVLKIAESQIGYCEKKTNAYLYDSDFTKNKGSANFTKYAVDLYKAGYWNGNKNGYDWCTSFVAHCIWVACGKSKEDATKVQPYGSLGASCKYETGYYKKAGRFFTEPKVGDQAFFVRGHTGIVEAYTGKTITLIEGNSNNKVERRVYKFPNATFSGFGRPFYREEPSASVKTHKVISSDTPEKIARKYGITVKELLEANKEKYPKITIDFIRDGWELIIPKHKEVSFKPYYAKVDAENGLKVRAGAGTSYKQIGVLKFGTKIQILEEKNKFGRHNFNGKEGWSALSYTRKV